MKSTGDIRIDKIMPRLNESWFVVPFEQTLIRPNVKYEKLKGLEIKPTGQIPVIDQGERFICGYTDDPANEYPGPLPVVIFGDHTRRFKFVNFKFSVGADGTQLLHPCEALMPKFFYYYLCSLNLESQGYSRHYKFLKTTSVPIPTLEEQRRIVTKLENLLDKVDACRTRLEKIPAILKRFHQSVLAAACSGRLTADWRDKELHSNSSNQLLDGNEDLPNSWKRMSIRDIASSKKGSIQSGPFGSNLLHSEFQPTGILVIGIDNVFDGKFSLGKQHRISHQKYELLKKYAAHPLDVLVTVMATVGRCCVVPSDIETAIITKHIYRITVDHFVMNPYFLMQCIRGCPAVLTQVQGEIQGVTRPGINGAILKGINVPLPPITEQQEIVRRVEELFALANQIEARYQKAKAQVDKLTQSILAKAFRGELVPQDPNDEPVIKISERILR